MLTSILRTACAIILSVEINDIIQSSDGQKGTKKAIHCQNIIEFRSIRLIHSIFIRETRSKELPTCKPALRIGWFCPNIKNDKLLQEALQYLSKRRSLATI